MSGQPATDHDSRPAGGSPSSRAVRLVAALGAVAALALCGAVAQASADPGGTAPDADRMKAAAAPTTSDVGTDDAPPVNLGDDAELNELTESCSAGDDVACDLLFLQSPIGSEYEQYGDTCAGRQAADSGQWCGLSSAGRSGAPQPPDGLGTDPALDALAQSCYAGDMEACDELYGSAESGSAYQDYGDTCAGRQPPDTGSFCTSLEDPVPGTAVAPTTAPGESTTSPELATTTTVFDVPASTAPGTSVPIEPGDIPAPTLDPTGLGSDSTLDALAQSCYDGDLTACDDLYRDADPGTPYRNYGDTCAGRQEAGSGIWCIDAFASPEGLPPSSEPQITDTAPTSTSTTTTTSTTSTTTTTSTSTIPEPPPPSHVPPVTSSPTTAPLGPVPPPTLEPGDLGTDPALDALAQSCYDGDLAACDELWNSSDPESAYQHFADTCAGRQPADTGIWCVDAFAGAPPTTASTVPETTVAATTVPAGVPEATEQPTGLGDDSALDLLAQACFDGGMQACDDLFNSAPIGSAYRTYGDTCAGRQEAGTFNFCRVVFDTDPQR